MIRWVPAKVGSELPILYIVILLLGLAALLPAVVRFCARTLRPLMDGIGGSEGALAVDAMIQSPRRSSATVGALMIGLMFVFSTGGFIQSFEHVMDRWITRMINSDLFVQVRSGFVRLRIISTKISAIASTCSPECSAPKTSASLS